MTTFLRLLNDKDKAEALYTTSQMLRRGESEPRVFEVAPESFKAVPGAPFAYWVSDAVRGIFEQLPAFETEGRTARQGLATAEDFRFVRTWWEVNVTANNWSYLAKGGAFSPFYADIYLMVNWSSNGAEIKAGICQRYPYLNGNAEFVAKNTQFYLRPGIFQTLRASCLAPHLTPTGCIFGDNGTQAFADQGDLLWTLCLLNSTAADTLHKLLLGRAGYALYRNGTLSRLPIPQPETIDKKTLTNLGQVAWKRRRLLDTVEETSHAFLLPAALCMRIGDYDPPAIEAELAIIQTEINDIAFDLYGFSDNDRAALSQTMPGELGIDDDSSAYNEKNVETELPADHQASLLSWAVGVAFGRFDWRLATGDRKALPEPGPFDPLPAKSPGMLPNDTEPFHVHTGILVDDSGHPHDLTHLVEEVLERVNMPVPNDVRQWLQRKFFTFHLKTYSKSRRKAPIYWPLSTTSGSYTLWIYYPTLNDQTLYSAINDFLDGPTGKLTQVGNEVTALRIKGTGRSQEDEKLFEEFQAFELELIELRDTLLNIAQNYHPNHDDGVQITAAPLCPLFVHKSWQKVLKGTCAKFEKGDYDWAHLAMNYWPDRVREKCTTDKSLAIAHGLEELYVEPPVKPKKGRSKKVKEA